MSRHIVYIINPVSGKGKSPFIENKVRQLTRAAGIDFEIIPSLPNGDYRFLLSRIEEGKISDLVIAGGDGTINQVIGSLRGTGVPFGIIPCGSGNGLALAAGIPKEPSRAIALVLHGQSSEVDAFLVNNRFACMLCGLGFDAKVAHDFANAPSRGLATYIRKTVRNFFTARPHRFTVETGGQRFDTRAFFISVANSDQFGNHFTIAPEASLTDGLLDVVIFNQQNKLRMLWQTWRQVQGGHYLQRGRIIEKQRGVVYFQAPVVTITNHDGALFHMDGDPVPTQSHFRFEILEKAFRLYRPAPEND